MEANDNQVQLFIGLQIADLKSCCVHIQHIVYKLRYGMQILIVI